MIDQVTHGLLAHAGAGCQIRQAGAFQCKVTCDVDVCRRDLLATGAYSEEQIKALEKKIRDEVMEAAEFAEQSPEPDPSALWTDVLR
mgnify:CR=1 FL=1